MSYCPTCLRYVNGAVCCPGCGVLASELDAADPEPPRPTWRVSLPAVRLLSSGGPVRSRRRRWAVAGISAGMLAAGLVGGWGFGYLGAPNDPLPTGADAGLSPAGLRAGALLPGRVSAPMDSALPAAMSETPLAPVPGGTAPPGSAPTGSTSPLSVTTASGIQTGTPAPDSTGPVSTASPAAAVPTPAGSPPGASASAQSPTADPTATATVAADPSPTASGTTHPGHGRVHGGARNTWLDED